MAITQITSDAEIVEHIARQIEAVEKALTYNLCAVGEQVLNAARLTNSYKDQTGNLRSSLGYIVAMDGAIVQMSSFTPVLSGGEGAKNGKEYAQELVRNFPQGIVLIVVAGMSYASHVSARGYDVLDSAELLAEAIIPQMLRTLGFN